MVSQTMRYKHAPWAPKNGADMLPGLLGGVDMLPGLPGHANTPPGLQGGADMISGIKTYSTDKVQAGVE